MEWVTLTKPFSIAEADLIRSRLEAAGFTVTLRNVAAALAMEGYSMATGGIWVQVPSAEETEARQLLEACAEDDPERAG